MRITITIILVLTMFGCITITKDHKVAGVKIKNVSSTPDKPLKLTLENSNEFSVIVKAVSQRTTQGFLGGGTTYKEIQWIKAIEAKQILGPLDCRWPVTIFVSKGEKVIGAIKISR